MERLQVVIAHRDIIVTGDNRRKNWRNTAAFRELCASVEQLGILQPLLVRGSLKDGYELIAGERRLAAAAECGLSEVPCQVVDVDEQEAHVMRIAENLSREGITPMEEAEEINELATLGMSNADIARRLGKTVQYVARRRRLVSLDAGWLETLADIGAPVEVYELLAAQPDTVLAAIYKDTGAWWLKELGLAEGYLARYQHTLDTAPWALGDTSFPNVCTECDYRTSKQADLFSTTSGPDRCLDGACWKGKLDLLLARKATELQDKIGRKPVLVQMGITPVEMNQRVLKPYEYERLKIKGDKPALIPHGAVPALVVDDPTGINTVWIQPLAGIPDGPKAKTTKDDRVFRADHRDAVRRCGDDVKALTAQVRQVGPPSDELIMALAYQFVGRNVNFLGLQTAMEEAHEAQDDATTDYLWNHVRSAIVAALHVPFHDTRTTPEELETMQNTIKAVRATLGIKEEVK